MGDAINQNKPRDISKIEQLLAEYENYKFPNKTDVPFPFSLNDYRFENKLHFVKISFASSTFDGITKDRRAKFVDMLSAIGGTMGLLTGFSIISGVEIIYFGIKIILQILRKKLEKKKSM